jgi:hypothetical protein
MFRPCWWWMSDRSGEGFDPDFMREAVSYPHPPPQGAVRVHLPCEIYPQQMSVKMELLSFFSLDLSPRLIRYQICLLAIVLL